MEEKEALLTKEMEVIRTSCSYKYLELVSYNWIRLYC